MTGSSHSGRLPANVDLRVAIELVGKAPAG